jgi:hypothetical protein
MKKPLYILSIVVIIVLLLGLGFVLGPIRKNPETIATARANQSLELESFDRIQGTKYLLAEVTAERTGTYLGSSGYDRGEVRNLVFLDSETLSSHRLFETNTRVILDTFQYPKAEVETDEYNSPPPPDNTITRWLVYHLVKEDSNEDGEQNYKDLCTLAVSDINGGGYTELLPEIDSFSGMTMLKEGQLVVVYTKDGVTKASILDLENREVINTQEIVGIGGVEKQN